MRSRIMGTIKLAMAGSYLDLNGGAYFFHSRFVDSI